MNFLEALDQLKNPNDKFDLDMIAIRVVVLELLKRSETEVLTNEELMRQQINFEKKGKRK